MKKQRPKPKNHVQFLNVAEMDVQPNSPQTPKTTMKLLRQSSAIFNCDETTHFDSHEAVEESVLLHERPWYKEAVFYEVYVRAFCDGNGDGHGDIPGLTSQLDYISALGVNCIWLLPIYPSPLKDDGYDVAEYKDVHPDYGTLDQFKVLVKAVHERNMRIIVDLIPNHTSNKHWWFQHARSDKNSPYREYYVWSPTPDKYKEARIIFKDYETSNWAWDPVAGEYYWHRFFSEQPDLNYDSEKVREEMKDILRFWLRLGIDGFRVDAVPYLYQREGTSCENLPETHAYVKELRKMVDTEFPGKILLAEACQLPSEVREYFGDGDEFHMGFHFPIMPRIFMSIKAEDPISLKKVIEETPEIPFTCQWVTFLRNHDELTLEMVTPEEREWMWDEYSPDPKGRINMGIRKRLANLLDNDRRKIELAYSMLFTLPGSPIIYYGDEIGMGDNLDLPDRNGVRTPMQWDSSENSGFSTSTKLYSPIISNNDYNSTRVNVQDAQNDPSSLFNVIRHMIGARRQHQAFGFGKFIWVETSEKCVAGWLRVYGLDRMLIISNTSSKAKENVQVTLPSNIHIDGCTEIFTKGTIPIIDHKIHLDLDPYQFMWLNLMVEIPGVTPSFMR